MTDVKRKVSYFYDPEIGDFHYGEGHPMKPHRVRMTHSLVLNYNLYSKMDCYLPYRADHIDMTSFHSEEYIKFLRTVTPGREKEFAAQLRLHNMEDECTVFDGLWKYCQIYAGGSISSAVKLNHGRADIAINWAGGLHHGKKSEASGFCYVNDIFLAILELLKYHRRVLYVDIDVHHGDGVEEAFLTTDRVMTVSFHKYGAGFFPGTGNVTHVGHGRGKFYSINVPLKDGITDEAYLQIFKTLMSRVVQVYSPEAIVLQCGADSLAGDRLGVFNLTSNGHAECVRHMKSFGIPLMLLGGGGYKIVNVARCWAKETSVAVGVEVDEQIPQNEYYDNFAPGYELSVPSKSNMTDHNSREYIEKMLVRIIDNLRYVTPAPSVQLHDRPPDAVPLNTLRPINGDTDARPCTNGADSPSRMRLWESYHKE